MGKEQAINTCILCGKPEKLRGLCQSHYQKYRRQRDRALHDGISGDEFDRLSVEQGFLLPDSRFDSSKSGNPFMAVYEQLKTGYVVGEGTASPKNQAEKRAEKIRKKLNKVPTKRKKAE